MSDDTLKEPSSDLLVRIDERTRTMAKNQDLMQSDMKTLSVEVAALRPVKSIVYGAVAIILVAVLGAIIALVVTQHK